MGSRQWYATALITSLVAILTACGSTHSASTGPVPATIALSPTTASLEMGETLQLTASSQNFSRQVITVPITYNSSNTAVVTISNAGLICAGTWDSLVAPVRCTPGPGGVAQVTASTGGVISPPSTVYVHSHIDGLTIAPVMPLPTPNCTLNGTIGFSQSETVTYQATALSMGQDITPTVGPFSWSATNGTVAKVTTPPVPNQGPVPTQTQVTAVAPGRTQIFVSAGGVTSNSVDFITCPVQSITLGLPGGSGNVVNFAKSGTQEITATVTDLAGVTLAKLPSLTWSSSAPLIASAVANGDIGGTISGHLSGGATIIASCTPPSCNPGFVPPLPVYPNTAISVTIAPSATPATTNVYAATTGCANNFGCTSSVVQIAVPANTVGNSATLPNTPNSFVFDFQGKTAYLGSEHGLMVLNPANLGSSTNPITVHGDVTGKVLAISHKGDKVIVSDTSSNPNQVFVFDTTTTGTTTSFLISGATAAAFSPDDLKAYIVAGSNLFVYSSQQALQSISLTGPATDVTFLPEGAFAEVAGGANSGAAVTNVTTCTNTNAVGASVNTNGVPVSIQALVDGTRLIVLDPPGVDVITAGTITFPPPMTSPCPPTIAAGTSTFVNLGEGQFTPLRFLVASDSTKAYVLAANFGAVLVYDIAAGTSSAIALSGNAATRGGDLAPDGSLLYVAGSDGKLHVINTAEQADLQTVSFPSTFNFCNNFSSVCQPDLVVVQP
jgi:Bacterial Ig-like domain (group 2)